MAYSIEDLANQIVTLQKTDPAAAYAMYNGISGMGGSGLYNTGGLTIALRNLMGVDAAKEFVNGGTNRYGNTLFDPTTGQWGGMGEAQGKGGTIAGWDPTQFDRNTSGPTSVNYDPTNIKPLAIGTGLNAAQGITTNADGTYAQAGYPPVPTGPNNPPGGIEAPGSAKLAGGRTANNSTTALQAGGGAPMAPGPGVRTRTPDLFPGATPAGPGGVPSPGSTTLGGTGSSSGAGSNLGGTYSAGGMASALAPYVAPGAYTDPTRAADSTQPFDLHSDEGYQFRLKEALDATKNQAAARGQLYSGAELKALEDRASGLASDEYGAAYGRYDNNRKFNEGKFEADRTAGRSNYESDRGFGRGTYENDRDFGENSRRYNLGFDYGVAKDDRGFNEDQRRYDQGFNYTAATGDRAFDYGTLKDLAQLGMSGTSGNASLAALLANLTSNNTLAAGNAAAGGTIGSSNAVNQLISQLIAQMNGNKLVSSLP